jgi:imidazolonepropionase
MLMLNPRDRTLLVTHCGQLLTFRGPGRPRVGAEMAEVGLLRDGALAIQDGTVVWVGSTAMARAWPGARRAAALDAGGRVVLPGFVDSHTHALFAGTRLEEYEARIDGATYAQIARAGGGIQASARQVRRASQPALAGRLGQVIRQFLEYGTTTAEVKSGYGLEFGQELKLLRAIRAAGRRAPFDLIPTLLAHAIPARFRAARAQYVRHLIRRFIPAVARAGLAEFFDVFCDSGYFTVTETRALLEAAARAGLKLKIHAEQLSRTGAARVAAQLGAVSVDHLEHLSESDIRALRTVQKTRGLRTIATLLPGSVLHLGGGTYPRARALMNAGIPVALATNFNPGSSPSLNMQVMLSLACSQMRMSPAEALTAATINGAYAVSRGSLVGSLEPGKQADLVIMEVRDYREIPYFFGMNHCATVIKKGRVVYSKGRL